MNLRKKILDLLARTKGVDTSNLTEKQQYNIELLEQRIMYSATQAGAALGDAGLDVDNFENLAADSGVQDLFGNADQAADQGEVENFVNDLFSTDDSLAAGSTEFSSQDVFFGESTPGQDIHGTSGDDVVKGGAGNDHVTGGSGNDQVKGLDGNDYLNGNAGNDQVYGGAGDDVARGGTGDDFVTGNDGNDHVSGGEGNDQVRGNAGNDTVQGNDGNDLLFGNAGNDTIEGGDGNDRLVGGAGDDILDGGRGHDSAFFNNSFDQFSFELVDGNLQVTGASGTDTVLQNVEKLEFTDRTVEVSELVAEARAAQAAQTAPAPVVDAPAEGIVAAGSSSADFLVGAEGDDIVSGGFGDDLVRGAAGNDIVTGDAGNDVLFGNDGSDTIEGGEGNDRLVGGAGDDILDGGRGHDVAFFNNSFDQFSFELVDGALQVTGTSGTDTVF